MFYLLPSIMMSKRNETIGEMYELRIVFANQYQYEMHKETMKLMFMAFKSHFESCNKENSTSLTYLD